MTSPAPATRPRGGPPAPKRPRTTMRYDRARTSLDRHATYIVAAFIAGAAPVAATPVAEVSLAVPATARLRQDPAKRGTSQRRQRPKPRCCAWPPRAAATVTPRPAVLSGGLDGDAGQLGHAPGRMLAHGHHRGQSRPSRVDIDRHSPRKEAP